VIVVIGELKVQTIPLSSPPALYGQTMDHSHSPAFMPLDWLKVKKKTKKKTVRPCGNFPAERIIRRGREWRGTDTGYNRQQRPYLHLISPPSTNQQKHGPNEGTELVPLHSLLMLTALLWHWITCLMHFIINAAHSIKCSILFKDHQRNR